MFIFVSLKFDRQFSDLEKSHLVDVRDLFHCASLPVVGTVLDVTDSFMEKEPWTWNSDIGPTPKKQKPHLPDNFAVFPYLHPEPLLALNAMQTKWA